MKRMSKIMKSPKGVKSGVPERVSISCPTCDNSHDEWVKSWGSVLINLPYLYIMWELSPHTVHKYICRFVTRGNQIIMFVVNLINYLMKIRSNCINERVCSNTAHTNNESITIISPGCFPMSSSWGGGGGHNTEKLRGATDREGNTHKNR